MKFSNLYLKYNTIKVQQFNGVDPKTGENTYKESEYNKYSVIKEFIPNNKELYYLWGNMAYSIILDYDCKKNNKLKKLGQLCFQLEEKIKKGDIDIVFYDFVNDILPFLDTLSKDEISIIQKAHSISCGPLYQKMINLTTPQMFIDLFEYSNISYSRLKGG
jgi:hypothetical protein